MKLLSALGLYMLSTTHHMPRAIKLSPASRYLRPSSYLRHALLLGFSSSHSTYTHTHKQTHTQQCLSFFLFKKKSLFISFCSRKSLFFRHTALTQCCRLSLTTSLFLSVFFISLCRLCGIITVALLPNKSLNFCPIAVSLPLSL